MWSSALLGVLVTSALPTARASEAPRFGESLHSHADTCDVHACNHLQSPLAFRAAVATLVSGGTTKHGGQDGYALGAVALAGSLRPSCGARGVDMVTMVTNDVNDGNRLALSTAGWIVRNVTSLEEGCFGE